MDNKSNYLLLILKYKEYNKYSKLE